MKLINKDALLDEFREECCGHCLNCEYYSTMVNGTCGLVKGAQTIDNAIIIPKDATIGDVVELLFPKIDTHNYADDTNICFWDVLKHGVEKYKSVYVSKKLWDTPYWEAIKKEESR